MTYLPKSESIKKEALEIFSLANTYFVSLERKKRFGPFPYLRKYLSQNVKSEIVEKLLGIAIKLRFLDDQEGILKEAKKTKDFWAITTLMVRSAMSMV